MAFDTAVIAPGTTFWTPFYRLIPEITGTLVVGSSFVKKTAGNVNVASQISSHPPLPHSSVPSLTSSLGSNGLTLTWKAPSKPGITGYEIFYTPNADTPFGTVPLLKLPASSLSATLKYGLAGFYSVSTLTGSNLTLFNSSIAVGVGKKAASCASLALSSTTSFKMSTCLPTSSSYASVVIPRLVFSASSATLKWSSSSRTTIVSVAWTTAPGSSACLAGSTELDGLGAVTGGTSVETAKGDWVSIRLCQDSTGKLSLVKLSRLIL